MPISKENQALYPPKAEWEEIGLRIRNRAQYQCEWCGRRDREWQWVAPGTGEWIDADVAYRLLNESGFEIPSNWGQTKTVLTIAHLDHDPTNNAEDNLAALCQRCHLVYDSDHHQRNASRTRDQKRGQAALFEETR